MKKIREHLRIFFMLNIPIIGSIGVFCEYFL